MIRISRLDQIINYTNRKYSIQEQRAKLLSLNIEFLRDLAKMETYFSIKRRGWQILSDILNKIGYGKALSLNELADTVSKKALAEFGRRKWPASDWFFKKWGVKDTWNGEEALLNKYVLAGALLCAASPSDKIDKFVQHLVIDVTGRQTYSAQALCQPNIYIRVDPWATASDIKRLCKFIPILKKACFGFNTESKRCFARDLCWYLMSTDLKLTPKQIAKAWAKKRPDELQALIQRTRDWKYSSDDYKDSIQDEYIAYGLPVTVRAAVERMRAMIDSLSWKWPAGFPKLDRDESLPNSEVVLEIGELRASLTDLAHGPITKRMAVNTRNLTRIKDLNSK